MALSLTTKFCATTKSRSPVPRLAAKIELAGKGSNYRFVTVLGSTVNSARHLGLKTASYSCTEPSMMSSVYRFLSKGINIASSAVCPVVLLINLGLPVLLSAQVANEGSNKAITSAFDPRLGEWKIDLPGRVAQYDLVYKSPPIDPLQGIPLGNGDVAALAWCEGSKIILVLNKCDLWDDSKTGPPDTWDERYDYYTTQRQACRIEIDFRLPVFDILYLTDFEARLNLVDASMSLKGVSPFGEITLNAFIEHGSGILFCDAKTSFQEDVPLQISLERFGSRTFSMWYTRMKRDASIGLAGTEALADASGAYVTHKLTGGTFAVGAAVIGSNGLKIDYSREHSRRAGMRLTGKQEKHATMAFAVTSPITGNAASEAKKQLSAARNRGMESSRKSQAQHWQTVWSRSFMDYGDDYLNNLWYLTMYYAHASQGGKYPGRFNNGLWAWNHDLQQWNFYFHWNQQQLYWPLNAAGFHELVAPYLDFRFNSLRYAKRSARETFKASGAFISDVSNRNGYNRIDLIDNHTPVAEIALEFWRQYEFTSDRQFLTNKALPFILEAARFFESLLEKGTDGLYHARGGTGYEGTIMLRDGLTELVYARTTLATALKALKAAGAELPEAARWKGLLEQLAPIPVVEASKGLIVEGDGGKKINWGTYSGIPVSGNKIVAAGWGIKENQWLTTWYKSDDAAYAYLLAGDPAGSKSSDLRVLEGIFPAVPRSPVFPSGLVGLAQKDEPLYKVMTTTTLLYGTECMGWDPVPVVLARLGRAKELAMDLEQFAARWQYFINGWGHINGDAGSDREGEMFFKTNNVSVIGSTTGEKVPLPAWPFRHMSMEPMSVLATAMNEALLQSYDGTIRVFPAFVGNKTARFTLHAQGGFVVSSEINSRNVAWIAIKSLHGNPCKLELPWKETLLHSSLGQEDRLIREQTVTFPTKADELIILGPQGKDLRSWSVIGEQPKANQNVKYHSSGKVQLGLPRMF